jgi:hypothetical protein
MEAAAMRLGLLALALALTACMQSHGSNVVALDQESCSECHMVEYNSTTAPPHQQTGFPMTCADCHRNTGWQPALEGIHPDTKFPLVTVQRRPTSSIETSPHAGIKCLECHDLDSGLPSTTGENTNCIGCHPSTSTLDAAHDGAEGPNGERYSYQAGVAANFCRTCHPEGLAYQHEFDRTGGPHRVSCASCHDRTKGPDSRDTATCIRSGCHSIGEEDGHHNEVSKYASTKSTGPAWNFCLQCHRTGRN